MNGFLVIDKPEGFTSFDVVAVVRRALNVKKVGHLGTLDPMATGVLVLAIGEGTKLIEYMMGADKIYEAQFEFGKVSNTYDREGEIEEIVPVGELEGAEISREKVEEALLSFVGEIEQIPPVFSAIKIKGERAYAKARRGEIIEMASRKVEVHSMVVQGFQWPFLMLKIHCSSGTYIRSLAHDLGQKLGCGALLSALRRIKVGEFSIEQAVEVDVFREAMVARNANVSKVEIIPLEKVVSDWPSVILNEEEYKTLHHGQMIPVPSAFPKMVSDFPVCGFYEEKLVSLLEVEGPFVKVLKNLVN